MNDTITAISTALGVGAISIVRVSGPEAINVVNKIVKNKNLNEVSSHTINYNFIIDNDVVIDEVLISVMLAPKTFTCEDVIEINAHGGIITTNKILQLLLQNGCRLAEPGEFTKRAFLNGRIDLIQSEAVMDLINSKTEKVRKMAMNQLDGTVSNLIKNLRQSILEILANIEVNIDYPEYEDIEVVTNKKIEEELYKVEKQVRKIIKENENANLIKDGITTAIIGRPNVGKSSLLNLLIHEEKAIVTEIEGTTRDIVEGQVNLDGIVLNIVDTAGIRNTNDVVESIGVNKSLELLEKADLVFYVLNNNDSVLNEDLELLSKIHDKNYIIVINKDDLDSNIDENLLDKSRIIKISALKGRGIDELFLKVKEMFDLEKFENDDFSYLANTRALAILNQIIIIIEEIKTSVDSMPVDILEIDLKRIWDLLGEIIGETYQEELIDQLFSQFCLGK